MIYKTGGIASLPNITGAEYFFDTDPGLGAATAITVAAGTNLVDVAFNANTALLTAGFHNVYVRTKDANGKWSHTARQLIYKAGGVVSLPNITKAEYFIDTDPGMGLATFITVTAGADIVDVPFNAAISTITTGFHHIYIRTRDANGKWSHTANQLFYKQGNATTLPSITAIEYFIDTDPGFGKGVPVAINPATNMANTTFPINISALSTGQHRFYIRTRDSKDSWSLTNDTILSVSGATPGRSIVVNKVTRKQMCSNDTFRISFDARTTYLSGNAFKAELSDATGSFANPVLLDSIQSRTSAIIYCRLPRHLPTGNNYRVRVNSTNPAVTGLTSADILNISDRPELADTTVYIVCSDQKADLTLLYDTTGLTASWNTATPKSAVIGTYQLIVTNANGCQDTTRATVKQDIATWTGVISSDWHVAGNWNTGVVPTAKTNVIIPTASPACVVSANDAIVATIQIRPGASFKVATGRKFTITISCNFLPN